MLIQSPLKSAYQNFIGSQIRVKHIYNILLTPSTAASLSINQSINQKENTITSTRSESKILDSSGVVDEVWAIALQTLIEPG